MSQTETSQSYPTVSFQTSNAINGTPNENPFMNFVQEASHGGPPVFQLYQMQMTPQYQISERIVNEGDDAWIFAQNGSELGFDFLDADAPAYAVEAAGGALVVQFLAGDAMQQDTTQYAQAGVATIYMTTEEGTADVIISYVEKLGPAISAAALLPAITTILGAFKKFIQSYLQQAFGKTQAGETDIDTIATESADEAAEDAALEGEIVADEIALDLTFSPLAIAGIALAAVSIIVSILLFFLAKTMTLMLRFYNDTDLELQINLCYQHDLEVQQEPQSPVIPPRGVPSSPPGVQPLEEVIYRADFTLQNNDSLEGIGIGIAGICEPTGPNPAPPGFALMVDIPNAGDNSLYAGFGEYPMDNCEEQIWDAYKNKYDQLAYGQSFNADGTEYTIGIATNQLRGESPSPVTGQKGYYYEYVVILQQQS